MYKLIGPALVRQDALEARANVKKRLEFIASELARLDSQLKALEEKQTRKHNQASMVWALGGEWAMMRWSGAPTANRHVHSGALGWQVRPVCGPPCPPSLLPGSQPLRQMIKLQQEAQRLQQQAVQTA